MNQIVAFIFIYKYIYYADKYDAESICINLIQ